MFVVPHLLLYEPPQITFATAGHLLEAAGNDTDGSTDATFKITVAKIIGKGVYKN